MRRAGRAALRVALMAGLLMAVGCGDDASEGESSGGGWVDPNGSGTTGSGTTGGGVNNTGTNAGTNNGTGGGTTGGTTGGGTTGGGTTGGGTTGGTLDGEALYAQHCASCHGAFGEGLSGPALTGWERGRDALVSEIDLDMPLGRPEVCEGACAEAVADFVLANFVAVPGACDDVPDTYPPRALRLLTRREYTQTVRDLLGLEAPCEGAACIEACQTQTFTFDPQGASYTSVHVAGSFNDWPGTVGDGGWPMTYDNATGLWSVSRVLADGRYSYKFVLNERDWITDPSSTDREDDGFGGQNAVRTVACGSAGTPSDPVADLVARFPVETRPEGYTFDNNAAAGRVTAVHADEYMSAAQALADLALTERRDAIVTCSPGGDPAGCAREVLSAFGRRAFRRPLTSEELGRYTALVTAEDAFDDGLRVALRVMLASPNFLYRFELGEAQSDGTYKLGPYEVATALSYTFWGTMPDDALLDAAERGELSTSAGIELQARRLLGDARARDLVGTFAVQWLGVERVLTANKRADLYPSFTNEVRAAMLEETRRFVSHVVFDGSGAFGELMTADYTIANPVLARHYGLAEPSEGFARVAYSSGRRSGLLGHGSILASTSHSDQTSPILRGVFIRESLLCQEFGIPPADAGGVPDVDPNATTRERFRQHTDDPTCYACHRYIDDVGFGFEHFDPVGAWRDTENGQAIDALGNMNDVEALYTDTDAPFHGLPELGQVLAGSDRAGACFTAQVYRFVTGNLEHAQERCTIQRLHERFQGDGEDIRELFVTLVTSDLFTVRRASN